MLLFIEILAITLILLGLLITCLNLPGSLLILSGILLSAWYGGFQAISVGWFVFFCILTVISLFLDNITMLLGAKRFGASNWGIVGAFIGGLLLTIFLGPIGVVLGPFVGALVFELIIERKVLRQAARAGFGSFLGTVLGICGKLLICLTMTAIWAVLEVGHFFSS
jgi:uncharacterized protein YqgC (DUF456 family)